MKLKNFFFLCLFFYLPTYAQILIMVPVYNRPDFIELQYRCFAKFLKDDYKLILFNDANDPNMQHLIEAECARLNIECVRVPQELHNVNPRAHEAPASFRHGEVLDFAFQNYGFKNNDLIAIFDSDMFLIKDFSIKEYLGDNAMNCFINNIITHFGIFNPAKLVDTENLLFHAKYRDGNFVDVAEDTPHYVLAHNFQRRHTNILWSIFRDLHLDPARSKSEQIQEKGYGPLHARFIEALINEADYQISKDPNNASKIRYDLDVGFYDTDLVIDYKHGSGWHGPNAEMISIKDRLVKEFLQNILN